MLKSFFLLILSGSIVDCANILYLSNVPSPSHFIWCKSILHALHQRGHNITALSGDVEGSKVNMTFLHLDQMYSAIYNGTKQIDFFEYAKMKPWELLKMYGDMSETSCVGSLKSKGYKQLLDYPDNFKVSLSFHFQPYIFTL